MPHLALVLSLCTLAAPQAGDPLATGPNAPAPRPKVLVLGVDGMRHDALERAATPHLDRLVAAGRYATDATNAWTPQQAWNGHSATNWGVLLTGVTPTASGLTANGDEEHRLFGDAGTADARRAANGGEATGLRTLFGHLRVARPALETGVFHTWPGIAIGASAPLAASGAVLDHAFCPAEGESSAERDVVTVDAVVACLAGRAPYEGADPDVLFVHLSQLDSAGHAHRYGSPQYGEAVARVDGLIGRLVAALEARPGRGDEAWLLLLSADHGGPEDSTDHANNALPAVHTVPLLLWADDRLPAALERPSLYSVTPTVLDWMGVDPAPLGLAGRSLLADGG